ncbi:MAG: hypothetical protein ACU0FH_15915 [Heliomarina sp.]|uniref:hypothetical protein n=1 Tax=Heliomarina sp. TaxID=2917556 RepID=UPI00405967CD
MRFLTDDPILLNELLWSRDPGRVVFFCGEGVSQAKAKLSNFLGLASDILKELKVRENASAARLLNEVAEARSGVPGAIGIDHVFGLLQRDYPVEAIEAAVAKSHSHASLDWLGVHGPPFENEW